MTKRQDYIISRNHNELATIPARSYEEAAKKWAQRESGKRATAYRTTGDFGKSGYFRAYLPVASSGGASWESIGDAFHVGGGE